MQLKLQDDCLLDLTHTKIDSQGLDLLESVAAEVGLQSNILAMFDGHKINKTEKRQVWHVKLRDFDCNDETVKQVEAVRQ